MREIIVARDIAELNKLAAEKFIDIAEKAIAAANRFTVALSGGSTPKGLFRLLASEPFRSQVDWEKVLFFFGDERNVPPDSDESNFRMANENLFQPLHIKAENIFRWKTELGNPTAAAADYEATIKTIFAAQLPEFDLIFLGMGGDGHTASLFPGSPGLDEEKRVAIANAVSKLNTTRLTLTFPVLNSSANVVFLVAGADKAPVLTRVLKGDADCHELPSCGVNPKNGMLYWFVDAQAASDLSL